MGGWKRFKLPFDTRALYLIQSRLLLKKKKVDGDSVVKNLPAMQETVCNARDAGSIPGPGRSPGEGNGKPLQYSCLGNLMDKGAWWAAVHGVARVRHD